jgi:hypothetical protein
MTEQTQQPATITMIPKRFEQAVENLVKAYFNGTLEKRSCTKCAVGNICQANTGLWHTAIQEFREYGFIAEDWLLDELKNIESFTGYSVEQLEKLESVFENNTENSSEKEQYKGLCAVFDKLCEIEGIEDSKPYKQMLKTN